LPRVVDKKDTTLAKKYAMTKRDLIKLRNRLPKKYTEEIISELPSGMKFSPVYIKKVLSGERSNEHILRAAIIVAERNDKVRKQLKLAAQGKISIAKI
jgi:hypothetical protein